MLLRWLLHLIPLPPHDHNLSQPLKSRLLLKLDFRITDLLDLWTNLTPPPSIIVSYHCVLSCIYPVIHLLSLVLSHKGNFRVLNDSEAAVEARLL
jgi:hypothetical protein